MRRTRSHCAYRRWSNHQATFSDRNAPEHSCHCPLTATVVQRACSQPRNKEIGEDRGQTETMETWKAGVQHSPRVTSRGRGSIQQMGQLPTLTHGLAKKPSKPMRRGPHLWDCQCGQDNNHRCWGSLSHTICVRKMTGIFEKNLEILLTLTVVISELWSTARF